jgi:hypothetical protein
MSQTYFDYELPLTDGQLEKLRSAVKNKNAITLKFNHEVLNQRENLRKLMLTRTQINKIENHKVKSKGVEIRLSQSQLRKNQIGGLLPIVPILTKAAAIAAPLALSAVTGLINGATNAFGNKLVGKGKNNVQLSFSEGDLNELVKMVNVLENKNILPTGSKISINKDIEQRGGSFVLPLVASLLGTFLPTLFNKGNGVYLPWEQKN